MMLESYRKNLAMNDELRNITPGQRPRIETDEAGLWMVMDRAEEDLRTSGHLVRDEKLSDYLKSIACRLVPEYCDDIRIYVVEDRIPRVDPWMNELFLVSAPAEVRSALGEPWQ
jgi:hypothetical protein